MFAGVLAGQRSGRYTWLMFLLFAGLLQPGFAQKVTAVSGVSITVADIDRETDFFTRVLDFQKVAEENWESAAVSQLFGLPQENPGARVVTLRLGEEKIRLIDFDPGSGSDPHDVEFNRQTRSNDLWFQHLAIVVSDMDAAYRKLLENKVVHVSTAPQTLPDYLPNAAGIRAFYFRDPEGHNLELIWFPPGKGAARWQATPVSRTPNRKPPSGLFLGIDHSAIGIADTDAGMAFYRDLLGLIHGGHSENYGPEQEHLNQVFGARLSIDGLHAGSGPGVEFLRYIAPPGGRVYPAESSPADLWHYQTEMEVDRLPELLEKLEKQGYKIISAGVVRAGTTDAVLVRDPDGHAVLLLAQGKKEKG